MLFATVVIPRLLTKRTGLPNDAAVKEKQHTMKTTFNTQWKDADGNPINVSITRNYLAAEDTCPECKSGLRIVEARAEDGEPVFRIECLSCGWTTEALPDPEAEYYDDDVSA